MKINEITVIEDPSVDKEPATNIPASSKTKRNFSTGSAGISQDDITAMRFAYKDDPAFINLIQIALMQPHIKTMSQAISYANTELTAQSKDRAKTGTGDDSVSRKPGSGTDWSSDNVQSLLRKRQKKLQRGGLGKGTASVKTKKSKIPGLDTVVKKAGEIAYNFVPEPMKPYVDGFTQGARNAKSKGQSIAQELK